MKLLTEHQQLGDRICEMVFFFSYGLATLTVSRNGRSVPACIYPFRDSPIRIPKYKRIQKLIATFLPNDHQSVIPSRPARTAITKVLAALKRNEILGDNLKKGRVDVLPFGHRVPSPRGEPISLVLRSEAPVVPMYLVRNYAGDINLIIEPEIELLRSGSLGEDIATNTWRMVRYLESLIGKYPDQWNWLTVHLNKHHLDRSPDMNVSDSSNLDPLPEDRKKDAARGEDPKFPILCLASIYPLPSPLNG